MKLKKSWYLRIFWFIVVYLTLLLTTRAILPAFFSINEGGGFSVMLAMLIGYLYRGYCDEKKEE